MVKLSRASMVLCKHTGMGVLTAELELLSTVVSDAIWIDSEVWEQEAESCATSAYDMAVSIVQIGTYAPPASC